MLPVTMTFTRILLLIQAGFSITASSYRTKLDIEYGDNGNLTMLKAVGPTATSSNTCRSC